MAASIHIELTNEEAATLREVLSEWISDLRMEVAGTDRMEFRESLKQREAVLKGIVARLG